MFSCLFFKFYFTIDINLRLSAFCADHIVNFGHKIKNTEDEKPYNTRPPSSTPESHFPPVLGSQTKRISLPFPHWQVICGDKSRK